MTLSYSNNVLTLKLGKKIDYTVSKHYALLRQGIESHSFQIIDIDFSQTKFITLPGGMYLLFILSSIISSKNKKNIYIESRISNLSEPLLVSIANFGLINVFITYANLKVPEAIKQLSESKSNYWKNIVKKRISNLNAIYWPVTIIPTKTSDSFENDVSSYINNFTDYFNALNYNNFISNLSGEVLEYNRKSFIRAINEATKNVWDHSQSWGAASIYSSKNNKTTMCLFDYGIGFINSYIKRKGEFERNAANDKRILRWLFEEHNTSNDDENHGRGLARIAKFIDTTNGIWLIKTDKYMMQYDSKGLKISEQSYFPGTQIMINF